MNADLVFGKNHMISAVEHALRSFERKTNTTNSLEKEILLYASGERQLKLAIPKIGVKSGNVKIAIVLLNNVNKIIPNHTIDDLLKLVSLKETIKFLKEMKILSKDLV